MSDLMWTEATRDAEAEQFQRRLTAARVATVDVWPMLAGAQSQADYENRKALVAERLDKVVASLTDGDPAGFASVRAALEDIFDTDYRCLVEAHQAEQQARTAGVPRCYHCDRPLSPGEYDPEWGEYNAHPECERMAAAELEVERQEQWERLWDQMDAETRQGYEQQGYSRTKRAVRRTAAPEHWKGPQSRFSEYERHAWFPVDFTNPDGSGYECVVGKTIHHKYPGVDWDNTKGYYYEVIFLGVNGGEQEIASGTTDTMEQAIAICEATVRELGHLSEDDLAAEGSRRTANYTFTFEEVERGYNDQKAGSERFPGETTDWQIGYDAAEDGRSIQEAYDDAEAAWDNEEAMYGHDWHGWKESRRRTAAKPSKDDPLYRIWHAGHVNGVAGGVMEAGLTGLSEEEADAYRAGYEDGKKWRYMTASRRTAERLQTIYLVHVPAHGQYQGLGAGRWIATEISEYVDPDNGAVTKVFTLPDGRYRHIPDWAVGEIREMVVDRDDHEFSRLPSSWMASRHTAATRQVDQDPDTGEWVGSEWEESEDGTKLVQSASTFGKNPRFSDKAEADAWAAGEAEEADTTKSDQSKTKQPAEFQKKQEPNRAQGARTANSVNVTCNECGNEYRGDTFAKRDRCPECGSSDLSRTSVRKTAANPYSPDGNPYVVDQPTPGTPDDQLDGPLDPMPRTLDMPTTTRPRQIPSIDTGIPSSAEDNGLTARRREFLINQSRAASAARRRIVR